MAEGLEIVKTFAPVAAPLTAAIVETWVKPKLQKLYQYIKTDTALFENALATKFDEYLQRAYQRNSYINVIVFQNQQKKLEDLYIPLTVVRARDNAELWVNDYKEEFIPTHEKVLIRDTAGMGKSTLMKFLFLCCVNLNEGIPIFIELRKLRASDTVFSYISNELNSIDEEFDKDFILKLIKQGGFIFFLDGYDEIPFSERDQVTSGLQDFIAKAGNNRFILSSRPESSLASFTDFEEFTIRPLLRDEAFNLIRKYDSAGGLSEELISKLNTREYENIDEFLENPLLVSLLYKSYEYKHKIPLKKHIFYRQVYDALFESHDLTKGGAYIREKHSGLDIEEFHRVVRNLGFITVKLGQVEFDKDALLSLLQRAKANCYDLVFKESDVFKDLLTTVPLFTKDGNYFRWTHKSIQEYFSAQFIWLDSKGNQGKILRQMVRSANNSRYYNVLDIYSDIDYSTFEQTLVYDCVSDFIRHFDTSFTLIDKNEIGENNVANRKTISFNKIYVVAKSELKQDANAYQGILTKIASEYSRSKRSLLEFKISDSYNILTSTVLVGQHKAVLRIFYKKRPDIFIKKEEWDVHQKMVAAIRANSYFDEARGRVRKLFDSLLEQGGDTDIYVLGDDPKAVYNQKQNFENVNIVLYGDLPGGGVYLDIDRCRALKLKIEEDIAKETSDGFIFDDI